MAASVSSLSSPVDAIAPQERPSSSINRRFWALMVDAVVMIVLNGVVLAAGGQVVPIDQPKGANVLIYAGFALGLLYLAAAPVLCGASLGKLVLGLGIRARDGAAPSAARLFARGVVLWALFPLNALLVLFRSNGRHLGDELARVDVVRSSQRSLWLAAPLALALIVLGFSSLFLLLKLSVQHAEVTQVARRAAAANDDLPLSFNLADDSADFYLSSAAGPKHVVLRREGSGWKAILVESVRSGAVPMQVGIHTGRDRGKQERLQASLVEGAGQARRRRRSRGCTVPRRDWWATSRAAFVPRMAVKSPCPSRSRARSSMCKRTPCSWARRSQRR